MIIVALVMNTQLIHTQPALLSNTVGHLVVNSLSKV